MRSVASSPRFYVSSAVDSRPSGFHVSLRDPLAGWGGAPPPAVDPISRAGYLSCPNDNAVHDRSGHPGGYHNPGWKNFERSGGGRRCLHRLRGQPLDNAVIAIDTRTGAQTVISAEGEPTPSPSTPPGTPLSPATPQPEPHRSSNGAVTHPRRLSAGNPQRLPGGAKGCAPRHSNPNLLIRRHRPILRPGTKGV